jgi:hypothetical protein
MSNRCRKVAKSLASKIPENFSKNVTFKGHIDLKNRKGKEFFCKETYTIESDVLLRKGERLTVSNAFEDLEN